MITFRKVREDDLELNSKIEDLNNCLLRVKQLFAYGKVPYPIAHPLVRGDG